MNRAAMLREVRMETFERVVWLLAREVDYVGACGAGTGRDGQDVPALGGAVRGRGHGRPTGPACGVLGAPGAAARGGGGGSAVRGWSPGLERAPFLRRGLCGGGRGAAVVHLGEEPASGSGAGEEGTWSSLRGVWETVEAKGLFDSLYTDRGSHYWHTPEAGGKVDKDNPTQFGRAMAELGIEMIAAYSPQARGRSERQFGTLQGAPAAGAGAGGDHRDGCGERVPEGLLATLQRGVHGGAEGAGERVLAPGAVVEGEASRHPLPEDGADGRQRQLRDLQGHDPADSAAAAPVPLRAGQGDGPRVRGRRHGRLPRDREAGALRCAGEAAEAGRSGGMSRSAALLGSLRSPRRTAERQSGHFMCSENRTFYLLSTGPKIAPRRALTHLSGAFGHPTGGRPHACCRSTAN